MSPSLPGPSTPSRRLGEASLEGSRGLSCLSPPRQGAEGLEEAGVGSGEGVKVAGLKLWRAPPSTMVESGQQDLLASASLREGGPGRPASCLKPLGRLGPASKGGTLRVSSPPAGEGRKWEWKHSCF